MGGRRLFRTLRLVLLCVVVAAAFAAAFAPFGSATAASTPTTVVSLTFDDGTAGQYAVRSMLAQNGLKGTFYVNSGTLGTSASYLSWRQLSDLQADGNEIAGHTINHDDLTQDSSSEAQRQVCDDRRMLMGNGFHITDFAYPSGATNPSVAQIVAGCGYNSARIAWGLCSPGEQNCQIAETIPPGDRFEVQTTWGLRPWTTLADMEGVVTRAEQNGGGWVPFLFHQICYQTDPGCDPTYSNPPDVVAQFFAWLGQRNAGGQTVVRTMHEVIGGIEQPLPSNTDSTPPVSTIACDGASCAGWHSSPVTVSLSAIDSGAGVAFIRYTTDGSDPSAASPQYSGPFTVNTTTTVKYAAWDKVGNAEATKSQAVQIDTAVPVSSIQCNGAACSNSTYGAPVSVSLSAADSGGSGVAAIRYTTDGSDPTSSSTLYTSSFTVSATTTVKYRAWDNAGNIEATNSQLIQVDTTPADTTPPTSTIACNGAACSSNTYSAPVSVSLSAADSGGSGVAAIRYTTDGSDPTSSSTLYTSSFTVSATTTVKYRAWDNAGNTEATKSQLIQVATTPADTTPPTSVIRCNGAACSTGWYAAAVSVSLSATDNSGGSGVAAIRYTTDGSDPTSSSTLYTSSFTVSATTTVKYRAWDNAGNTEATKSQLVRVDTTVPTVTLTSPTNGATVKAQRENRRDCKRRRVGRRTGGVLRRHATRGNQHVFSLLR